MTAAKLIVEVRKCGAVPLLIDGKLKVAPPGKLPTDLKDQLCQRADEIKILLMGQSDAANPFENVRRGESDRPALPTHGVAPDSRHLFIADAIRVKIEAIEAEARAKGWPAELLWNNAFWDLPRGLAAVLDPNDEIAEVTPEIIEIVRMRHDVLRFRRHGA